MKKIGRYIALLIIFLSSILQAQDVKFYASVDKNPVAMGDVFSYKITLENGRGKITAPDLSNFNLIFGPSQSSSYQIINNRQSSTLTLSYTLRPIKEGKFKIGQANVNIDGKYLKTEPIVVEVTKGKSSPAGQNYSSSENGGNGGTSKDDKNIILSIDLSKREAYIGEQISATYTLLTRYQNLDVGEMKFPTLKGFWTEDLKDEKASWERDYEYINGVPYRKAVLKRQILFPQRNGEIEIEPVVIEGRVDRSFFNPGRAVSITSNSPKVKVKSLPANTPKSFNGAVGTFQFKVDLDKNELKANEAINLKIDISGSGNLQLVDAPKIGFPSDFEVYDPEVIDRINVSANGLSGRRRFQYLIIPRYPGEYTIEKFEFSFFNPQTEKYEKKFAGPFTFRIAGEQGNVPTSAQRSKKRVTASANDVRYIISEPESLKNKGDIFFSTSSYYIALGTPFLCLLIFLFVRKRKEELEQDVVGSKKRKANKAAKKRLKEADKALSDNNASLFYAELSKALYGYLENKLVIPKSQLTKLTITQRLKSEGVDDSIIQDLFKTLNTCEMARFAPDNSSEMSTLFKNSVQLIESLEGKLK